MSHYIFSEYATELVTDLFELKRSAGGPRYSRTFYLRINLFTLEKRSKMTTFQSKMDCMEWNVFTTINERNLYNIFFYFNSQRNLELGAHLRRAIEPSGNHF